MRLKYLIEKEFRQFFRNPFLPRIVVAMPILLMAVFPFAATQDVTNVRLVFVDHDHSVESRRLIEKTTASGYFIPAVYADSYNEALDAVQRGDADVVLEIAPHFGRNLKRDETSDVMIAANAVNGTKGSLGSAYLQGIVSDFASDIQIETEAVEVSAAQTVSSISERYLFNPTLDYKIFMIPALMTTLLTLLSGFLPALNIVSEKERGTIEQINVTPVGRFEFILGKLIPYWIIGLVVMTFAMFLAWLIYDFRSVGSLVTIYVFAIVFISMISGFGLLISNYSDTMQQAMFVMFFFMLIFLLLSGLFTPVTSMPEWAQWIAACNPLHYFVDAMRMIFLKGSTTLQLLPKFLPLVGFAIVINMMAVYSYKKSS